MHDEGNGPIPGLRTTPRRDTTVRPTGVRRSHGAMWHRFGRMRVDGEAPADRDVLDNGIAVGIPGRSSSL